MDDWRYFFFFLGCCVIGNSKRCTNRTPRFKRMQTDVLEASMIFANVCLLISSFEYWCFGSIIDCIDACKWALNVAIQVGRFVSSMKIDEVTCLFYRFSIVIASAVQWNCERTDWKNVCVCVCDQITHKCEMEHLGIGRCDTQPNWMDECAKNVTKINSMWMTANNNNNTAKWQKNKKKIYRPNQYVNVRALCVFGRLWMFSFFANFEAIFSFGKLQN